MHYNAARPISANHVTSGNRAENTRFRHQNDAGGRGLGAVPADEPQAGRAAEDVGLLEAKLHSSAKF
jgi:hypothetical protein